MEAKEAHMQGEVKAYVLLEQKNGIAYIILNRPVAYDALNHDVKKELQEKLEEVARDKEMRVAIITGAGQKAFSAGADLDELVQRLKPPTGSGKEPQAVKSHSISMF